MLIKGAVVSLLKTVGIVALISLIGFSNNLPARELDSDDDNFDQSEVVVSKSQQTPSPTYETALWGNDVRIGTRDSIYVTSFDIHRESGNLFTGLLFQYDSLSTMWSINISTDGGASWSETDNWWANYTINSVSASVLGNYCYVAYSRGSSQNEINLRRFNVSNGLSADFNDSTDFVTILEMDFSEAVEQVVLTSNQDETDDRLDLLALTSEGNLRHFWSDTSAVVWTEDTTGVHDAYETIDLCTNEGYTTYPLLASYFSPVDATSERINIIGNSGGSWQNLHSEVISVWGEAIAISAYRDTIVCAYEDSVLGDIASRTKWSYDGGSSWVTEDWLDDTTVLHEFPDVAARGGGGVGVVYRFYTDPREGRFKWRDYNGSWSDYVVYNDDQLYTIQPALEYIGDDVYGVVFISWNDTAVKGAYFDRSDWMTGIGDSPSSGTTLPRAFSLSQNYPNPFNPSTTIALNISGTPGEKQHVEVTIYDIRGRQVFTLIDSDLEPGSYNLHWNGRNNRGKSVSSGIYLYTLKTKEETFTRKMTILK
jgi:hypothetical protein